MKKHRSKHSYRRQTEINVEKIVFFALRNIDFSKRYGKCSPNPSIIEDIDLCFVLEAEKSVARSRPKHEKDFILEFASIVLSKCKQGSNPTGVYLLMGLPKSY